MRPQKFSLLKNSSPLLINELMNYGGEKNSPGPPLDFVAKGHSGLTGAAVKCRGREYLRIMF